MPGYARKPYDRSPLIQFLGAYYHEDWRLDAANWTDALTEYLNASDAAHLGALVADIDEVFAERDDPEVARLVCVHLEDFNPEDAGFADRWSWLEVVRVQVLAELAARRK